VAGHAADPLSRSNWTATGKMLAYALTFGRLVLAGAFAACVAAAGAGTIAPRWAVVLVALAVAVELTDLFDGIAARRAGKASRLGGLLDPLCDSLARLTMYFSAALAGWVTVAVPLMMVGRDLVVAYVRTVRAHVGGPTSARRSGKTKAIIQGLGIIALVLLASTEANWASAGRWVVAGSVLAVTLLSMIDYVWAGWGSVVDLYRMDISPRREA